MYPRSILRSCITLYSSPFRIEVTKQFWNSCSDTYDMHDLFTSFILFCALVQTGYRMILPLSYIYLHSRTASFMPSLGTGLSELQTSFEIIGLTQTLIYSKCKKQTNCKNYEIITKICLCVCVLTRARSSKVLLKSDNLTRLHIIILGATELHFIGCDVSLNRIKKYKYICTTTLYVRT